MSILNVAAYKFVELDELAPLREKLVDAANSLGLRGTILLAREGVNMFIAGEDAALQSFLDVLTADSRFAGMPLKRSWSQEQPFNRMLVKIKKEIIPFGRPDIDPGQHPAPRISPQELKAWLDSGRRITLLDTRNDYEVRLGTFAGAIDFGLKHFRDFPAALEAADPELKDEPIVTFCTGGIRCEKAAPLLINEGFREVYQLDGGILAYFEQCGDAHFDGECFVFDRRVALDPNLEETGTVRCFACLSPLSPEEQKLPTYVPDISCPHCAAA